MDVARQDLRYAWRLLRQSPTFTLAAVATLALGIGAAVTMFTIVDAVLLRPLPVRDGHRLGIIDAQEVTGRGFVGASWTKFTMLRAANDVFSDLAAYVPGEFTTTVRSSPEQVLGMRVTARFFDTLGVRPVLGRAFATADEVEHAAPVAVVTDAFWRVRLGADPAVVTRAIRVDGRETAIVGVLPPAFRFQFSDREPQIYLSSVSTPGVMTAAQIQRGAGFLGYVGRLVPGVTFERAREELARFDERYERDFGSYTDARKYRLHLVPLADSVIGDVRPPLLLLMAAVVVVLLVACANVAHLLLAHAAGRRRELAMRLALGASPARLVRQVLTESVLLAAAGGLLGVLVARAAVTLIAAYGPPDIPRLRDAAPDGTALLFAIAAACASAFLFGTLPALRAGRVPPGDVLRDGRTGGNTSRRLHRWLAGSEAAVTVTLLVIASLLFESLVKMQQVEPGFTPDHVYAADVSLPRASYAEPARREAFFSDLLRRLGEEPGIGHVGATSYLPMSGSNYGFFFFVEGQPHLGTGRDPVIAVRHVSADYFRTMKIPVRRGRAFTDADAGGALPVAIINETAARKFFPNVDPVGRHLANSTDAIMREIVGVVGDVRFNGPTRPDPEELYLPYRQMPWPSMSIVISSSLGGDAVAAVVRRDVARIDPDQAVADIRPMQRLVAASTTAQQFVASLIGLFAVLAIALAAIGVYGVISLFVAQRRQEFGVRMALGAQRSDVMLLVLREGAWMTLGGAALGLAAAAAASRALGHLLFGVSATEPSAYVAGTLALVLVGLAASYFPARRAMSTEPAQALRSE